MPLIGLIIVILLILILFTKVIPLGFLGNFSFLPFKIQFSAFGDQDLPDTEGEQKEGCTNLNIADEYRDFYGNNFINTARDSCNLNGVYIEEENILGCSFDKDSLTVDCNTPAMDNLENFCEKLDATWVCDNSEGFVGCICERSIPELECWWQKIDEINIVLNAGTSMTWFENLPKGKYKFDWNYDLMLNTDIIEDPSGDNNIWSYDDEKSGNHIFINSESFSEWGIQIENIWRSNSEITIELYQWVCEGDNLDWTSHIFDNPDYINGEPYEQLGDLDMNECSSSDGECLHICILAFSADSAHCEQADWEGGSRVAECPEWSNSGEWKSCFIKDSYCQGDQGCDCVCEIYYTN